MTSNVGSSKFEGGLGFMKNASEQFIEERLKSHFKEEFINRIDEIILFSPLDVNSLSEIARARLAEVRERIKCAGISLEIEDDIYRFFAEKGEMRGFGARPMNRLICRTVENKIAEMIVSGKIKKGATLLIKKENEEIKVVCRAAKKEPKNDKILVKI